MSSAAATNAQGTGRPSWAAWAGTGFTLALLALTSVVFYGMGPKFKDASWYEPTGWLARAIGDTDLYPLADELRYALALFGGLAVVLTVAIGFTTRSATARFLAGFSLATIACVLYYAINAPFVWEFFEWRWSGSMLLFAAAIAAVATSPFLAASWLRLPTWARVAIYLPIVIGVLAYERNITGTDQMLRFAISPWPVVQIFGIELFGTCLGALVLGVGLGLLLLARAPGNPWALRAAGALLAGGLPALALWVGSEQNLLPGKVGPQGLVTVGVIGAVVYLVASLAGAGSKPGGLPQRAKHWATAGVLVLVPILLGQLWARLDYATTRDERAQLVIDALAAHYEAEEIYPDDLEELVESGALEGIPSPRIGFAAFTDQEFVYQNFGTSFLLEFSAPRWIQCAYNPPYPDEYEEEYEEGEDGEGLGVGSWSCPSKPPELW